MSLLPFFPLSLSRSLISLSLFWSQSFFNPTDGDVEDRADVFSVGEEGVAHGIVDLGWTFDWLNIELVLTHELTRPMDLILFLDGGRF